MGKLVLLETAGTDLSDDLLARARASRWGFLLGATLLSEGAARWGSS